MAGRLNNIAGLMKNTRSRLIIIVTIVLLIALSLIGYWQLRDTRTGAPAAAAVSGVPGIESIPGSNTANVQYIKTQEEENRQQAERALKTGSSAIPTILRSETFDEGSFGKLTGGSASKGFSSACVNLQNKYPYCFAGVVPSSGGLSSKILAQLAAACRAGMPASACRAELQKLVAEGKLTPEEAAQLLGDYGKAGPETAGEKELADLIKSAGLSPSLAAAIQEACNKNASPTACADLLKRLVAKCELTAAQARRLLSAFGKPGANELQGAEDVCKLVKSGKLTAGLAAEIAKACAKDVPKSVCAALLRKLVAEGKLSPAEARKLLQAYGKTGAESPAAAELAKLIGSGNLTPTLAADIARACAKGVPASVCQAELRRLVAEGKLTPAEARKLLGEYGKGLAETPGDQELGRLVSTGDISPALAKDIANACKKGAPPQACIDLLKRLVAEGKLTPEQARKLLAAYGRPGGNELGAASELGKLLRSGAITPALADDIRRECSKDAPPGACARLLRRLVAEGKLTPAEARKLLGEFGKPTPAELAGAGKLGQLVKAGLLSSKEAAELAKACSADASPDACAEMLKKLVEEGKLTPAQARKLLAAFGKPGEELLTAQASTTRESFGPDSIPSIGAGGEAGQDGENKRLHQILAQQAQYIATQQLKQQLSQLKQAMNSQASALFSSWNPPPTQNYVAGAAPVKANIKNGAQQGGANARRNGSSNHSADGGLGGNLPVVKAGNIEFGILMTGVNSDQTITPVMIRIVHGKFKGAKLLGSVKREGDKVILTLKRMNMPSYPKTISVNAVAINPTTAQAALASNVDHHYLVRYGTLFAASFLEGYSQAITQSGSQTTVSINGITHTYPQTSPRQKLMIAMGNTGSRFAQQLQPLFNMPPTVTVNSGTGVGVLFLSDVTIPKLR